jgi:hypothetical protein
LDSMNVLAEIVATINDHSSGNFSSSHVPRTNNVLIAAPDISDYPKWIQNFKFYFFLVIITVAVLIFLRVCIACGCCSLFKLNRRSSKSRSHAQPASEMARNGITGRNSTGPGVM